MKAFFLGLACISLHEFARRADRLRLAGSENGNAVSLTKTPRPSGG
jgi:hypothetical protein